MRVLRVFHGGSVAAYRERDKALAELGNEVALVAPREFQELPEKTYAVAQTTPFKVVPVGLYGPKRNPWYFYNPWEIGRVFRSHQPDILDLHEEPYSLAAASVLAGRRIARSRAVLVFRSSQNVFKRYPFPFSAIQRRVLRVSRAAYVPSDQAKVVLRQKGLLSRVDVIGNGVPVQGAETMGEERPAQGCELKFAYVGRLIPRKGIEDLVEALDSMDKPFKLVVIGSGALEPSLRGRVASSARLSGSVEFRGALEPSGVLAELAQADVVCVPSRTLPGWSEQFSRALVEGMAQGCVPLTSDSGALPEVSGGLVEPAHAGSVSSLRSRIESLYEMDLSDVRRAARERALEEYSWEATSRKLYKLYEYALEESE